MTGENWRDIPITDSWALSNYQVSDYGRIRTKIGHNALIPRIGGRKKVGSKTYRICHLKDDHGYQCQAYIHALVARTFKGAPPPGMNLVRHLDGNGENNHEDNLAWGDRVGNLRDDRPLASRGLGNTVVHAQGKPHIENVIAAFSNYTDLSDLRRRLRELGIANKIDWT